jgi:hypothetical protein
MVLIIGAALAALLRGLLTPESTYQNARALIRIARSGGAGSQLARSAIAGYFRGEGDAAMLRVRAALEEYEGIEMTPLLSRFAQVGRWADESFIPRAYGTAEEGFAAALEAEGVTAAAPFLAPFLAAAATAGAVLDAEHHRHGIGHDLVHPIDAFDDVLDAVEDMATGIYDKLTGHKRKQPDPDQTVGKEDDFSGIQYTFYEPTTGRIQGYKGIRRFGKRLSKKTMGKSSDFGTYDLDSARPVSRIRPE